MMHDCKVCRAIMSGVLVLLTSLVFTSCNLFKITDVIDLVPACSASSEGLFTVLPLRRQDIKSFEPMGWVSPPVKTYPCDHGGFSLKDSTQPVPVYAPGHIWIYRIIRIEQVTWGFIDYGVWFYACKDVHGLFGHVLTLSDSLMQAAQDFSRAACEEQSVGGVTYRTCEVNVALELSAGDLVGTISMPLDFNLYDNSVTHIFANPSRVEGDGYMYAVSVIPYFDEANQVFIKSIAVRTVEPIGGTIEQDIPGTAQGIWIRQGGTFRPEDPNLSLVHDSIDPSIPVFSIGTSLPNFGPGIYSFVPSSSGFNNRDFGDVVPSTTIYVYENLGITSAPGMVLLVRLVDANTLWLEAQQATDGPPWNFTSSKVVFER